MEEQARTPKQIATVLRWRRKELGLSQGVLALKIRRRQTTVSALENAATDSRLGTLLDALAGLDLEMVIRARTDVVKNI
jgi:HTH-type transcriptional regulator/antitoxin HipB